MLPVTMALISWPYEIMFRKILSFASSETCEVLCRPQIPDEPMVSTTLPKNNLFTAKKSLVAGLFMTR